LTKPAEVRHLTLTADLEGTENPKVHGVLSGVPKQDALYERGGAGRRQVKPEQDESHAAITEL
jgi:hypothetical protein